MICYYVIQNIIDTNVILTSLVPRSKDLGGSVLILTLGYLPHRRRVMPSRLPPRDCVSRPYGHALASARMRASLWRFVIARENWKSTWPKTQRADTAHVLPVTLFYVASSLAEPRLRIRECLTPRVYVAAALSRTFGKPCS